MGFLCVFLLFLYIFFHERHMESPDWGMYSGTTHEAAAWATHIPFGSLSGFCLLHFPSSFLLELLRRRWATAHVLVYQPPTWETDMNSRLLTSAWLSLQLLAFGERIKGERSFSFSIAFFLIILPFK